MGAIERGELLSMQVDEAPREMIRKGSLAPAEWIPSEKELADLHGVSRATVPDALASLQVWGLSSAAGAQAPTDPRGLVGT
jgi:DNA-binding GntR family transcriptional regulator